MKALYVTLAALFLTLLLICGVVFIPPLLDPVVEYESRVTIEAPRAEVWKIFNDDEKTKQWIEGLKTFERISGDRGRPGSKYRLVVDSEGEDVEMIETITEVKEGELFAFTMDAEPLTDNVRVTFEDINGSTVMTQSDSITGKTFYWKALFYWLQSTFRESTEGHLMRFKKLVEDEQKGR